MPNILAPNNLPWEYVATPYDGAVDGVLASFETPLFDLGFEYLFQFEEFQHNSGSNQYLIISGYGKAGAAYWADTGGVWTSQASTVKVSGQLILNDVGMYLKSHAYNFAGDTAAGGIIQHGGGIYNATWDRISKVQFAFSAGSIAAGVCYMYRRKTGAFN